jgi:hypothetical protein
MAARLVVKRRAGARQTDRGARYQAVEQVFDHADSVWRTLP